MHDLSLYLLEMLENAVRAKATVVATSLTIDRAHGVLELTVDDDGDGLKVSPEQALDPFFTTKSGKKTGLGLSLFKAEAEAAGGTLTIGRSELGGVCVRVGLQLAHVDRPPLGDVAASLLVMAATSPKIDFRVGLKEDAAEVQARWTSVAEAVPELTRWTNELAQAPAATPAPTDHRNTKTDDRKDHNGMAPESENHACTCGEQASEEELLARLDEVIAGYKSKPGALIPVLQIAQGIYGYLPEVALKRIAKGLQKPYSEVAGVVGFYSFFSTVPRGRNLIRVCLGTACYVRGGIAVLDALKKELDIDVGGTTEDREFSLEVARCFGACGLAPVITVNDDVHHRVKPRSVRQIVAQYSRELVAAEGSV